MARALRILSGLLVLMLLVGAPACAVERELAGVRLGIAALALLDQSAHGQPDFVGPIGTIALPATQPQAAGTPGAGVAGGRSGPVGPGARALRGPGMASSGGGPRGPGMASSGGGPRGPGMAPMGGGLRRPGGAGGAIPAARQTARPAAGQQPSGMFWYYRRPGGAVVVAHLDIKGKVEGVTLSGSLPYFAGRTSRGIGLTSSYMEVISRYGYPDQSTTLANAVELTYLDHGVRFRLEGMRVKEIAIGTSVTRAVQAAPLQVQEEAPPPAGLTIEELRGYL